MRRLTANRLVRRLLDMTDGLRGGVASDAYPDVLSAFLVLKRFQDEPSLRNQDDSAFFSSELFYGLYGLQDPRELRDALSRLGHRVPLEGVPDHLDLTADLTRSDLQRLSYQFSDLDLADEHLEFRDTVGRAYDLLLGRFAESGGKKGGEFYTPRSVVRTMVRLVDPQEGQSVHDPFAGSGGMLIAARDHVEAHGGDGSRLGLYGQERNGGAWATARLNLLLHGLDNSHIVQGDTLADPLLTADGRLRRFDRVLANPPFSMNYDEHTMRFPERMKYGQVPSRAKKADLMQVQHVLAVLEPEGVGAVVVPHGVLFRTGAEYQIRRGMIEDDRIAAVIGIGPNVFYGTSVPACILVLRGTAGAAPEQRGRILFVNAEHETATGRTRKYLDPQSAEKIVETYLRQEDVPGFSRVVHRDEIAAMDFSLNIPLYVDGAAPSEGQLDVRAALFGGVPRREIALAERKFRSFGVDPDTLFTPRDSRYVDFLDEGYKATAHRILELSQAGEERGVRLCRAWWGEIGWARVDDAVGSGDSPALREPLLRSFRDALLPLGVLDRHQLAGVFASWWSERREDLESLDRWGYPHVLIRWSDPVNDPPQRVRTDGTPRECVLDALMDDLCARLRRVLSTERLALRDSYLSWGDRYAVSLADLEEQGRETAQRLRDRLGRLGYG
ncbi:N-6 DNA methylase [Streptomyces amakusaensis]|uniref:site-specific DNA-methyltransferase (adenine-specific) n=1 Tax=Streptomyces amakusaensis TaxID=67271 RepID=A0ABW0AGK9_9ACTN